MKWMTFLKSKMKKTPKKSLIKNLMMLTQKSTKSASSLDSILKLKMKTT